MPSPSIARYLPATAFVAAIAGCPSGASQRGVEHPESARGHAAGGEHGRFPSCRGDHVDGVWSQPGFCATRVVGDLERPRHLTFAPNGDLLVATRRGVVVVWDADGDGSSSRDERATLGGYDPSNQGIAMSPDGRYIYTASGRDVRRIPYEAGLRHSNGPGEVVIPDLPATVDHPYHTITFDREGRLYVQTGSDDNLHQGDGANILRFTIPAALPEGGMRFATGERFAYGIRNAEALAWDGDQRLWAFVNGRDYLNPPGAGESFYLDHPGDWIFRLSRRAEHVLRVSVLLGPRSRSVGRAPRSGERVGRSRMRAAITMMRGVRTLRT